MSTSNQITMSPSLDITDILSRASYQDILSVSISLEIRSIPSIPSLPSLEIVPAFPPLASAVQHNPVLLTPHSIDPESLKRNKRGSRRPSKVPGNELVASRSTALTPRTKSVIVETISIAKWIDKLSTSPIQDHTPWAETSVLSPERDDGPTGYLPTRPDSQKRDSLSKTPKSRPSSTIVEPPSPHQSDFGPVRIYGRSVMGVDPDDSMQWSSQGNTIFNTSSRRASNASSSSNRREAHIWKKPGAPFLVGEEDHSEAPRTLSLQLTGDSDGKRLTLSTIPEFSVSITKGCGCDCSCDREEEQDNRTKLVPPTLLVSTNSTDAVPVSFPSSQSLVYPSPSLSSLSCSVMSTPTPSPFHNSTLPLVLGTHQSRLASRRGRPQPSPLNTSIPSHSLMSIPYPGIPTPFTGSPAAQTPQFELDGNGVSAGTGEGREMSVAEMVKDLRMRASLLERMSLEIPTDVGASTTPDCREDVRMVSTFSFGSSSSSSYSSASSHSNESPASTATSPNSHDLRFPSNNNGSEDDDGYNGSGDWSYVNELIDSYQLGYDGIEGGSPTSSSSIGSLEAPISREGVVLKHRDDGNRGSVGRNNGEDNEEKGYLPRISDEDAASLNPPRSPPAGFLGTGGAMDQPFPKLVATPAGQVIGGTHRASVHLGYSRVVSLDGSTSGLVPKRGILKSTKVVRFAFDTTHPPPHPSSSTNSVISSDGSDELIQLSSPVTPPSRKSSVRGRKATPGKPSPLRLTSLSGRDALLQQSQIEMPQSAPASISGRGFDRHGPANGLNVQSAFNMNSESYSSQTQQPQLAPLLRRHTLTPPSLPHPHFMKPQLSAPSTSNNTTLAQAKPKSGPILVGRYPTVPTKGRSNSNRNNKENLNKSLLGGVRSSMVPPKAWAPIVSEGRDENSARRASSGAGERRGPSELSPKSRMPVPFRSILTRFNKS
ncbi:hypothetical protein JAAARDRAFT_203896 [Jaapia argillacea MUCL 33604]|uniref:Uncharacterized protein n=1 Tax=Jaapia argillacea MUCL 33604 TaxID=933084 RepID=A0A067QFI6_9AGAM|nr:hypothetical protein JAAARDRAFT_203896 [Jaapia argillacea MUCL 33604]